MPLGVQPKLLRALQEKSYRPVGSDVEVRFDVRIVAATNRDLQAAVRMATFREDLYYRLDVIQIELPPLRHRGNDVLLLAQGWIGTFASRFGKRVRGLSGPAAERLLAYSWPGNVRELRNCVERAVALTRYEEVAVEDLPERIRNYSRYSGAPPEEVQGGLLPLEEVERQHILRVLEAVGHKKALAARILGLDRKTLYRKMERFGWGAADGQAEGPPAAQ